MGVVVWHLGGDTDSGTPIRRWVSPSRLVSLFIKNLKKLCRAKSQRAQRRTRNHGGLPPSAIGGVGRRAQALASERDGIERVANIKKRGHRDPGEHGGRAVHGRQCREPRG